MRRHQSSRLTGLLVGAVLLGLGAWWFWPRGIAPSPQTANAAESGQRAGAARPEVSPPARLPEVRFVDGPRLAADVPLGSAPVAQDAPAASPAAAEAPPPEASPRIAAALRQAQSGQIIEGRHALNQLLNSSTDERERDELRGHLARIADQTIFSTERHSGDPAIELYRMQSGDVLINIGKRFDVPAEAIMLINGITNPRTIGAGKTIKVPRGPFHARIASSKFRMDVYLRDLYVRSYPVGLGANGTPHGVWLIARKDRDPAYYPPSSDSIKKVIYPGDPDYPLGGYWIALEGLEGDAIGKQSFGIHGTNKPESIGRAESLGCIRMRNEDVKIVYGMLHAQHSKVTVLP